MHHSKWSKYLSFTSSRDWLYRYSFGNAGLRSIKTDLGEGTVMHCWVPKTRNASRPNILLVHGFGANAMWQYGEHLRHFTSRFNVYVPDLIFFGESYTTRRERTESFQAESVMKLMEAHGVGRMSLIGISYGGFVGYSMAAQFPDKMEKLVLCCAGVCLEEKDLEDGFFNVSDLDEALSILLPQTPEKLRDLMKFSFVKPMGKWLPSFFLSDFIDVMCTDYLQEKRELLVTILKDRKISNIPKITQSVLIIWGEEDKIFPLELGYRLKRHVGENAQIVVIKNAGHAVNLEKSKDFLKHLKSFLFDSQSTPPPPLFPIFNSIWS
ncbi:metacaspase-1-like isoform X2 [Hibiscus syriacus]|uniref:Metacaspase-1-like isoform X2 n=1 Tax=Hibiscus syriacus TaxID=106335 RepID=A0A6A3BBF6_HIBSY|nr:uncharacterized protein Mb2734-like [Hibiscus syriacus]KAE8712935.1 metacaspase-1-like isoform X2 [Hibiscus syriacus]